MTGAVIGTGETGFPGQHTARALPERSDQPFLLGRDFSPVQELIQNGVPPIQADLRDRAAIIAACQGKDAVTHAGTSLAISGSRREIFEINIGGTGAGLTLGVMATVF